MKFFLKRVYSNSKEYILFAVLLVLSASLLSLNSNSKIQSIKILAFGSFAYINSVISEPLNLLKNVNELEIQKKLNAELMLENSLLKSKAAESERLMQLLNFKDSVDAPLIGGKIISKFGSVLNGKFVIDVGSSDSVRADMPVISDRGLVGIVELVAGEFSVVRHIYNSSLSFAVSIRETNTEGILNWNGRRLVIENIPTTTRVRKGYKVYTSDFSTIFPPDIPVGEVTGVETTIAGLLSEVTVKANENIDSLGNVFVVIVHEQPDLDKVKAEK